MQPPLTGSRAAMAEADVIALIKTDPTIKVGAGLELLDRDLNVLTDISEHLQSGEVSRSNFATLHGSCSVNLTTQLAWGSAIIRPYMLLQSDVTSARFNLGAYFTNTPDYVTGVAPVTFDVIGYDMLDALNQPVGDSYAVNIGVEYLTAIETILINQGYSKYTIDSSRVGTMLPAARGWPIADNVTWLTIVNDLLASIGYRGIYSDWDGQLICVPYISPESQQTEWDYDDGQYTSELGPQQTVTHDYYNAPNKWIGVRSNNIEGESPTEGNGIFIYQNDYDGETSVEGRGGRVFTKKLDIEAADQAALQTVVMQQVASDKVIGTSIAADTTPNPLHWHFDILSVITTELGPLKVRENEWKLPLDGGQMSHVWAVI